MSKRKAIAAASRAVVESLERRWLLSSASLIAWFKLDEPTGSTAVDSSGNGFVGNHVNAPLRTAGRDGLALSFDPAAGNRVLIADSPTLDITGPITLSAWIKPTTTGLTQNILRKGKVGSVDGYELGLSASGKVFFRLNQSSAGDTFRVDSSSLHPTDGNTWMHVAGTYDGATMRLYINGGLQNQKAGPTAINVNSRALSIGAQDDGYRAIKGAVDDVRVFSRAITDSEVQDLYLFNDGPPANAAPAVNAGADASITPDAAAFLDATVTDDGLPDPLLFSSSWTVITQPDGASVTFANASAIDTQATFSQTGIYVLRLTASDGELWASDDVQITVAAPPANAAPQVDAGEDQTVNLPNGAALWALITDDNLPGPASVTWTVVGGEAGNVTFANAAAASTAVSFSAVGVYTLRATASDGELTGFDDVQITVNAASATYVDPGLVGWWKLDDNAGSIARDSSGNGLDGSLVRSPTWTAGVSGSGVTFTPSLNNVITVQDRASLDFTSAMSVSVWVKPNTVGSTQYVVRKGKNGGVDGYELSISSDGRAFFRLNQASNGDAFRVNSVTVPPAGTWTHLLGTFDGSTIRMYVNGVLENSKAAGTAIAINTRALAIGAQDDGYRPLNGALDDVRLYNRAVSADEAAALAALNPPPVVNAGADASGVAVNTPIALTGSAADDTPATLSVKWMVISQPAGAIVTFDNLFAAQTSASFSAAGVYVLRLTAADGTSVAFDELAVQVGAINQPPTVNAGADTTATAGVAKPISGSASDDGVPGNGVTVAWSVVGQPDGSTVSFANASAASTTATFSAAGTYTLRLTASDGQLSSFDDVIVTVAAVPPTGEFTATSLANLQLSATTEAKPQNKLWKAFGQWFAILPNSSGTWVYRLDNTTWTPVLKINSDTGTWAEVTPNGDGSVVHAVIQKGSTTVRLASLQYNNGTYEFWSQRPGVVTLPSLSNVETVTMEIDSAGRMWIAYDTSTSMHVRYADGNYSTWSSAITIASNTSSDDISTMVKLNGKIGVFWSNQTTKRFGFRTHTDGDVAAHWSNDEKPGDAAALNVGKGMADDHMNAAVAADGTLYMVVKTSYDSSSQTVIGLLIRRPNGTWDNALYQIDTTGTRPIVVINDQENALYVFYTSRVTANDIAYRKTSVAGPINFGPKTVAIKGSLDNVTSTKQNVTGDLVVMATTGGHLAMSTRFTWPTPTAGTNRTYAFSLSNADNTKGVVD